MGNEASSKSASEKDVVNKQKLGRENEMIDLQHKRKQPDALLKLDELSDMCYALEGNVFNLSLLIDSVIFDESTLDTPTFDNPATHEEVAAVCEEKTKDAPNESVLSEKESQQNTNQLTGAAFLILKKMKFLTVQLDFHSRLVESRSFNEDNDNDKLSKCVIILVNNVNGLFKLLLRKLVKFSYFWFESFATPQHFYNLKYGCPLSNLIENSQGIDAVLMNLFRCYRVILDLQVGVIATLITYRDLRIMAGCDKIPPVCVHFLSKQVLGMCRWLVHIPGWVELDKALA